MSTITTKSKKSKKTTARPAAAAPKPAAAYRHPTVQSVAEDLQGLVRILHKGAQMLPVADDVPAYLADATVLLGDLMLNLSALDGELAAPAPPASARPAAEKWSGRMGMLARGIASCESETPEVFAGGVLEGVEDDLFVLSRMLPSTDDNAVAARVAWRLSERIKVAREALQLAALEDDQPIPFRPTMTKGAAA